MCFLCFSRCIVSEEHFTGPSMSVCRAFPTGLATRLTMGSLFLPLLSIFLLFSLSEFCSYSSCYRNSYCYFYFYCLLLLALAPLALPSPGWTPLGLYHLSSDHPKLRRTGTVPEKLGHFRGLHPVGTPLGNTPTPNPIQDF